MRPEELLSFLHKVVLLKCRTRHNQNPDGRPESVAEHSFRIALMADLLRETFPALDMDRVVSMCLYHDLGEAVTGDIPTFEKTERDEKTEKEAVSSLLSMLPEPERGRAEGLFREIEEQKTDEARLFKALDKLEAVVSHNEAPLESWIPLEYDLQKTYGWKEAGFAPFLTALRQEMLRETEEKIKKSAPQP